MRGDGKMKHLRQFLIILLFSFLGEGLKALLPLPVPASIYGLVLLFTALEFGIIKLSAVENAGKFLIEIMPVMFIPAAVGLLESWDALRPVVVPVLMITAITTVVVMVVTGLVTQIMIKKGRRKDERVSE